MRLPLTIGFVGLLGTLACHGSSGGGSRRPLTNLGVSAAYLRGEGDLWLIGVSELDEGGLDRNGDNDTDDVVLCVYDFLDGSLTDLHLAGGAVPFATIGKVLIAFGVPEDEQGAGDLNGDNDTDDLVLHVYDARTKTTTNTGLATSALTPAIGLATVGFAVDEAAQDFTDLDGSGAPDGTILHVFNANTGLSTNAQRNVTSEIVFHDHAYAFTTDEASAHAVLNGDGLIDDDLVFQTFDLVLGGVISIPMATRGRPLGVSAEDWIVLADETAQGTVLNGDGDTDDGVWMLVKPHLGTLTPLPFSSAGTFQSTTDGNLAGLVFQEIDGVDRNGDSDFQDTFVALYDTATSQAFVSGFPIGIDEPLVFAGERLGFLLSEFFVGDGNLDGSFDDEILYWLDESGAPPISSGIEALTLEAAGGRFLCLRLENPLVGDDYNGDGDFDDLVYFTLDPAGPFGPESTGLASGGPASAGSTALLLLGTEAGQNQDLNGDGDQNDLAWVRHDLASSTNLLLGGASLLQDAGLLNDGRGIVPVLESGQGTGVDLNGDDDFADSVLHVFGAP